MTKVLVSPGHGAGWSTWAPDAHMKAIATYQPIIKFIEDGGDPRDLNVPYDFKKSEDEQPPRHPLVKQMMYELGLLDFYTGGAGRLEVHVVDGPFYIDEYDGYETLKTESPFW